MGHYSGEVCGVEGVAGKLDIEPRFGIEDSRERALAKARSNFALGALERVSGGGEVILGGDVRVVCRVDGAVYPCAGVGIKGGKLLANTGEGGGDVGEGGGEADGGGMGGRGDGNGAGGVGANAAECRACCVVGVGIPGVAVGGVVGGAEPTIAASKACTVGGEGGTIGWAGGEGGDCGGGVLYSSVAI